MKKSIILIILLFTISIISYSFTPEINIVENSYPLTDTIQKNTTNKDSTDIKVESKCGEGKENKVESKCGEGKCGIN